MRCLLCAFCIAALGLVDPCRAATITIDFDDIPTANPVVNVPTGAGYVSQGYKIIPSDATAFIIHPSVGPGSTMIGGDGSNFLTWSAVSPTFITISRVDSAAFNLDSLLLGSRNLPAAHYSITSGVSTLVPETAAAGMISPGFTNLSSVTINWLGFGFLAIDEIQLTEYVAGPVAVPEPASAAFLGLGSLAVVIRRLRRRSSVVA